MNDKKNVFIMGDSYSTYNGYNPEGYAYYYSDDREDAPIVSGVEKTWWSLLINEMGFNLSLNDSYSGSTVCNTVREGYSLDSSFISRMDKYVNENYFLENKIDKIFIFGGTNDSWIEAPIGELKYSDWTDTDLKSVLPAFCYLINSVKNVINSEAVTVIINSDLNPEITENVKIACRNYNIEYVELKKIDKVNGHPTVLGMNQIFSQVKEKLNEEKTK